jgi:hypothetical protein
LLRRCCCLLCLLLLLLLLLLVFPLVLGHILVPYMVQLDLQSTAAAAAAEV